MNGAFKKRQSTFLIQVLAFSIGLFGIHSYLLYHFAQELYLFFPIWQIYTFNLIVTITFYSIINYNFSRGKTEVFNIFMICTISKMGLAILFLLPLILSEVENKQPDVFNFFIPYFLYLFFEVFALTKFLQK